MCGDKFIFTKVIKKYLTSVYKKYYLCDQLKMY